MSSKIYSIKCPNCSAPLKIQGGGRITTITCQYCGSVIDINKHYRVLYQFRHKYRPPVPLKLGMQGEIKGVKWTIIGWVSYKTVELPTQRWSEFFLYSEIYGYAWLVYDEKQFYFSRRVRDFPLLMWEKRKRPRTIFYRRGHFVAKEDSYIAEIDFVQGELTWIAKAGDKIECWDYNGSRARSLSIEKSKDEIEVYLNEKLRPQSIHEAFGIKINKKGKKDKTNKRVSLYYKGMITLLIILLITIVASFLTPKTILKNRTNHPFDMMFKVDSSAFLTQIQIKAPSAFELDSCTLELYKNGKRIYLINRYTSLSDDKLLQANSWHYNSNKVNIYIKLKEGYVISQFEGT